MRYRLVIDFTADPRHLHRLTRMCSLAWAKALGYVHLADVDLDGWRIEHLTSGDTDEHLRS